jgi:MFS family permease
VSIPSPSPVKRPLSLGVIFLTLYIDLIGFSIVFPLMPDMLEHYLRTDGQVGLLGSFVALSDLIAGFLNKDHNFAAVLFGGFVASLFSILQFIFAPIWGSLSDRKGRRPVLLWTVAGTAFGYLLWVLSGSFWMFVLSRVVCGAFGGNLSVATAAVADVTSREDRSKAMGLVGAAFGLGLITGPSLGALAMHWNPLHEHPALGILGVNPFSFPALLALGFSLFNLVWITLRFRESLDPAHRSEPAAERPRNALKAILSLENPAVRRINLVAFVFSLSFVAMEMTLTFLAAERFGYTARQNGMLLAFLGLCSILTQGVLVRRLLKTMHEIQVLCIGLVCAVFGLVGLAFATRQGMLYAALVFTSLGSGLVNPSSTGLISLYSGAGEQGRVLGIFRSLGALSRAITPVFAGALYWVFGSLTLYLAAACLAVWALVLGLSLPKPQK